MGRSYFEGRYMTTTAQAWARLQLTYKYPEEYRKLYLEEKVDATGSKENANAANRARSRLMKLHREEYQAFYRLGRHRGLPHSMRKL